MKAERTVPKLAEEDRFQLGDFDVDLSAYTVEEDTLTAQEILHLAFEITRGPAKPVLR